MDCMDPGRKLHFSLPGNGKTSRCLYPNRRCSQLDGRKSDSPYPERCKEGECCWQLQVNSLLESPLEITDWYY